MARILDKLNAVNLAVNFLYIFKSFLLFFSFQKANTLPDNQKRVQLKTMVKDELEKWEEPPSTSPTNLSSRSISPNSNSSIHDLGPKSAFRQQ